MQPRQGIATVALTTLLLGSPLAVLADSPRPQHLSQVTPNTIIGQLDSTSQVLNHGSYFNVHAFEGVAGELIVIDLVSTAFEPYLILVGPGGQAVAQDDDRSEDTNARLVMTLPTIGTYQIIAGAIQPGETGSYTLTWQPTTAQAAATDQPDADALARAFILNEEALQLYQAGRYRQANPLCKNP